MHPSPATTEDSDTKESQATQDPVNTAAGEGLHDATCSPSFSAGDLEYVNFCKEWDASGLPEYYERMDGLNRIGFTFDDEGDMDHYESEALSEWLGDERTVMGVSLSEIEAAKTSILAAAKLLLENADVDAPAPPKTL